MAQLSNVALKITPDVANADIVLVYEIDYDDTDVATNQQYDEVAKLIGVDVGVDPVIVAGGDDPIVDGQLSPAGSVVSANGASKQTRKFATTIPLANLNEDVPPVPNPDEIRASVTLTPILPQAVSAQSNLVRLTLV
jgi:hypothetical protein